MSKAFTKDGGADPDDEDDAEAAAPPVPEGSKNYMLPGGYERLRVELRQLLSVERPEVVRTVAWAASNGDRSENADYYYGKRRLREIDRRIRFLTKRLDNAELVDPTRQTQTDRVFFGATVTYSNAEGEERVVSIVGIDEADPSAGRVSWIAPIARVLLKARVGDVVNLQTPTGTAELEILRIEYKALE